MDASWSYNSWNPTAGVMWKWEEPSKAAFEKHRKSLIDNTKRSAQACHDPEARYQIAKALLSLGYPEIAAGEAQKAIMLSEAGIDPNSALGASVRSQMRISVDSSDDSWEEVPKNGCATLEDQEKATKSLEGFMQKSYLVLIDSLELLRAFPDMIEASMKALTQFAGKKDFRRRLKLAQKNESTVWNQSKQQAMMQGISKSQMAWARSVPVKYPWMPEDLQVRDEKTIAAANKSLESYSTNLEVRLSSLVKNQNEKKPVCLGMHAKRDIKKGEIILDAPCATGINTRQTSGHCYNCAARLENPFCFPCCLTLKFCSDTCQGIAGDNYHEAICGKDFTKIYEAAKSSDGPTRSDAQKSLLFLRILAICKQAGDHPLRSPAIAWLAPNYSQSEYSRQPWSMTANVNGPLNILQTLDEDIYAPKYDFWVLQTVWNLVKNNTRAFGNHGGLQQTILHPLYSFFNHSCAPNSYEKDIGVNPTSKIVKYAAKDIKKDEEVFTTYIHPNELVFPKQIRQQMMQVWLGESECACTRCKAERF